MENYLNYLNYLEEMIAFGLGDVDECLEMHQMGYFMFKYGDFIFNYTRLFNLPMLYGKDSEKFKILSNKHHEMLLSFANKYIEYFKDDNNGVENDIKYLLKLGTRYIITLSINLYIDDIRKNNNFEIADNILNETLKEYGIIKGKIKKMENN